MPVAQFLLLGTFCKSITSRGFNLLPPPACRPFCRLLSQSSSQTPLAHSQCARNGKALTISRKERAPMGFVGTHSCPNVAARLPTYWLSSPLASVPGSCYF